jgi:hypothetical protein
MPLRVKHFVLLAALIALLPTHQAIAQCEQAAESVFRNGFETSLRAVQVRTPNARTCYVAQNGNDAALGTIAQPFRTVQRCADVAQPGDQCVLREGVYRETVRPALSGSSSAPIVFTSYTGEQATISGADSVGPWTLESGSIYRASVSLPVDGAASTGFFANQVFANGIMLPQARHPNGSNDPMSPPLANSGLSVSGSTMTMNNASLPTIPGGWNGAILWSTEWFVSRTAVVTSSAPGTLTATVTDQSNWNRAGFWWTLTGVRGALDAAGEWHYDAANSRLLLWPPIAGAPSGIEVKRRNLAFDLRARSFITISNLSIFAATIETDASSSGVVLDGLDARYLSHYLTLPDLPAAQIQPGTDGFGLIGAHINDSGIALRGQNHTLKNSRLSYSAGNLLLLSGSNHLVENNRLTAANYLSSYAAAIQIAGNGHRILRNSFDRAGRSAINIDWKLTGFSADALEIAFNDITRFGLLSTDLGAIYVCCYTNMGNSRIHHNVIRDTQGFSPFWGTRGFYFDIEAGFNLTLDHNLVYGISASSDNLGVSAGSPRGPLRAFNNTFVNPAELGAGVEARNNILRANATIGAPTQGSNLFSATDPLFVAPASANFSLQASSPARDAGVLIPGITDPVIGAPDIGAFEFGLPPWRAGSDLPQ